MFCTNNCHMVFFLPLARIYKSGTLGFKIVMEALGIILTDSFANCLLSNLLILDFNSILRVGVSFNWKVRLHPINLVVYTLSKQAKTETEKEKMVTVVSVLLCLFVPLKGK